MKSNKKKGEVASDRPSTNLTTDDLLRGFQVTERHFESEYQKYKRRLGVSPSVRLMVGWK